MDIHLQFREFVRSKPETTTYSKEIVLGLVNTIIGMKIEHEGLYDPDSNKSLDADA